MIFLLNHLTLYIYNRWFKSGLYWVNPVFWSWFLKKEIEAKKVGDVDGFLVLGNGRNPE
jgi:hypothetical protein